jgi:hypothetical protein
MTSMPGAVRRCTCILWTGKASEKARRGVIPPVCVKYRRTPREKKSFVASKSIQNCSLQMRHVRLPHRRPQLFAAAQDAPRGLPAVQVPLLRLRLHSEFHFQEPRAEQAPGRGPGRCRQRPESRLCLQRVLLHNRFGKTQTLIVFTFFVLYTNHVSLSFVIIKRKVVGKW